MTLLDAADVHHGASRFDMLLRVMTFNLWVGGEGSGQSLDRSAEVIRAARADVAGLQETAGRAIGGIRPDNGQKVAALLGWNHCAQPNGTAIISRFPIVAGSSTEWGARITLPDGRAIGVFNAHLGDAPYQPYQLLGIPYDDGPFIHSAEEAVDHARNARGGQVESLLREMRPALRSGMAVFLTGDFNEPSHLDWTSAAVAAGKCPLAVDWPATRAIADAGLIDAYRVVRPDVVSDRGDTWTAALRAGEAGRHDRIDFVFAGGAAVKVVRAEVIGEDEGRADLTVRPYPSDHHAVVATVEL